MVDGSGPGPLGDDPRPADASPPWGESAPIERSLFGALPCVTCRYNLQGLSILANCPECGTAVRATILAVVDPHAAELRPITRPRAVAAGLLAWVVGALGAMGVLCAGVIHDLSIAGRGLPTTFDWRLIGTIMTAALVASGLGAVVLIAPHPGVPMRGRVLAGVGVLLYVPLALLVRHLANLTDAAARSGRVLGMAPIPEHTLLRIGAFALVVLILLCLRPNARLLVARSLALRTGRVDRQTMLAMAASVLMLIVGDILTLVPGLFPGFVGAEYFYIFGMGLMLVGTLLLLLGLIGSLVDCIRIARAVLTPSPGLGQVLSTDAPAATHSPAPSRKATP